MKLREEHGGWVITGSTGDEPSGPARAGPRRGRTSAPYVPDAVVEQLAAFADLGGEHRLVTVGFVMVVGVARPTRPCSARRGRRSPRATWSTRSSAACDAFGVTVLHTDIAPDGIKFVLCAGAPVSPGDTTDALLQAALEIAAVRQSVRDPSGCSSRASVRRIPRQPVPADVHPDGRPGEHRGPHARQGRRSRHRRRGVSGRRHAGGVRDRGARAVPREGQDRADHRGEGARSHRPRPARLRGHTARRAPARTRRTRPMPSANWTRSWSWSAPPASASRVSSTPPGARPKDSRSTRAPARHTEPPCRTACTGR